MPPKSKSAASGSKRTTVDHKMPSTKSGSKDGRYKYPQFCKSDGTRDMRTTASCQKT